MSNTRNDSSVRIKGHHRHKVIPSHFSGCATVMKMGSCRSTADAREYVLLRCTEYSVQSFDGIIATRDRVRALIRMPLYSNG